MLETITLGEHVDYVFELRTPQTCLSIPQSFAPNVSVHGQARCQYLDLNSGNLAVIGTLNLRGNMSGTGWGSLVRQLHTGRIAHATARLSHW